MALSFISANAIKGIFVTMGGELPPLVYAIKLLNVYEGKSCAEIYQRLGFALN